MVKLFALEVTSSFKNNTELETNSEEGEITNIQIDIEKNYEDIKKFAFNIEEKIEAANQLNNIQQFVEKVAKKDGLDPVAAEAVKIAIEAVCVRIGSNPKSLYSLYATENFTSVSSRRTNTVYALEGIKEFLKSILEKIKAAFAFLLDKIEQFWELCTDKFERSLELLESMRSKVLVMKRIAENKKYEEIRVPFRLRNIFPSTDHLGFNEIKSYYDRLKSAEQDIKSFYDLIKINERCKNVKELEIALSSIFGSMANGIKINFGSENEPMPGGSFEQYEFWVETESIDGENYYILKVNENSGKYEKGTEDPALIIAHKEKLLFIIDKCINECKELIRFRKENEKQSKESLENHKYMIERIQKKIDDESKRTTLIKNLESFRILKTEEFLIRKKLISYYLTFFKGVLMYSDACIKYSS